MEINGNDDFKNQNQINKEQLIVVLTVWKRNNLLMQLNEILYQDIYFKYMVKIVVFQNGGHINISKELNNFSSSFPCADVSYVNSKIETGYYGRFLVPMLYNTDTKRSYFLIFDDDIIIGKSYIGNMLRVVKEGNLCTRNGRFLGIDGTELFLSYQTKFTNPVNYKEDVAFDFGGQIWCGRMEWLQAVWRFPSPTFSNAEDFWISCILKTKYNISTKIPRCPRKNNKNLDLCACSHKSAWDHKPAITGDIHTNDTSRKEIMHLIMETYNYKLLMSFKGQNDIDEFTSRNFKFNNNNYAISYTEKTDFVNCLEWL